MHLDSVTRLLPSSKAQHAIVDPSAVHVQSTINPRLRPIAEDGNVVERTQTAMAAQPIRIKPSAMQIVSVMNERLWTTHVRTSIQATHAFRVTMIHTSRTITNPASGQHTPNRQLTSISLSRLAHIIHLNWSETKRQLPSYSTAEGFNNA